MKYPKCDSKLIIDAIIINEEPTIVKQYSSKKCNYMKIGD